MALAAPNPPWIRMTHPLIEGPEQYAMRDAWRTTWIYLGWETTDDDWEPGDPWEIDWPPMPDGEVRSAWSAPYNYVGTALPYSSETASVWNIGRIEILDDGTTTVTWAHDVAWTDRATETYS